MTVPATIGAGGVESGRKPLGNFRARGQLGLLFAAFLLFFLAPALLSDFRLALLAKYLCFALIAIGVDLAWGYGGMLVLGQGVFFGLGGYAMGMHLKLAEAGPGQLPDFMSWSGVEALPALWKPFSSAWIALPAIVLLPMVIAYLLGTLVFRRRVRGAYFAILSQALAAAFVILLIGQQGLTGGTNGLTNVSLFFGMDLNAPGTQRLLYLVTAVTLLVVYVLTRQLVRSRFGRLLVAIRDGEDRVRFLGYDPARVKLLVYVLAAGMAGLAGGLFVPVVGIISPAMLGIVPSIEMVVWVALGGRATLWAAAVGAVAVNAAKTSLSEQLPSGWLYFEGLLFILVVAFAPRGFAGLVSTLRGMRMGRRQRSGTPATEGSR